MSALTSFGFTLPDDADLSRSVILHPYARANRIPVAVNVVNAADVRPEFVFVQPLRQKRRLLARVRTIPIVHRNLASARKNLAKLTFARAQIGYQ